ncbi:hypothetical protein CBR_g50937 [Chara braunii]|uniref:Carbohydrate kinase FGGY C-terminal domain-containing protein n=1 Tax=Chara braunii TaxID=69332 RepID=A0A388M7N3_CHABU|nr:hypothetical protein CBR_g50937 [Chara braunii]|eukprot:GBG90594.1 hypothetical protein CBR_g50937 [Chara braunii]
MAMLVYKNGAFVREDIRDKCAGCSWESFSQKLDQTPPLNGKKEIEENNIVRALVEGQFLAMRAHSEGIGMPSPPRRIIATGGGSANSRLLSILASIFGCDVFTAPRPDSASLGAALRAAHGWLCKEQEVLPFVSAAEEEADGKAPEQGANNFLPFSVLIKHAAPDSAIGLQLAATAGGQEMHESYGRLMRVRQSLEAKIICEAGRRA